MGFCFWSFTALQVWQHMTPLLQQVVWRALQKDEQRYKTALKAFIPPQAHKQLGAWWYLLETLLGLLPRPKEVQPWSTDMGEQLSQGCCWLPSGV